MQHCMLNVMQHAIAGTVSDAAGAETSAAAAASVPVAAPLLDTSMHAAQTQARTQHKPPCQAASLKAAVAVVGETWR